MLNLIILISLFCESHALFVTIETRAGAVRGFRIPSSSGGSLDIYLGIPFAEAPIGSLRFAPPVEKRSWRPRILNATKFGPACSQPLRPLQRSLGDYFTNIQEDCLYLNVYAPTNINDPGQRYPVMVWVHGGYFKFGSGSVYDGRILASKGGVIVVTVNYRLGALGFLSTDDAVASGNQALLDQVLALKWVNKNIQYFGGDPSQVTLFGESAGSASVSLHMFSPLSSGLFQGLILQSGCALSPFAVRRPPHSTYVNTRNLALKLGCPVLSSKIMVDCLRHKYVHEIVNVEAPDSLSIISFAPRIDGYFLHDVPESILQRGDYNKNIKVLTGYVRDESSIFISDDFDENGGYNLTQYEELLDDLTTRFLHKNKVKSSVLQYYQPVQNGSEENLQTYMNLVSDYEFKMPHIKMAFELHSKGTKTWLYEFSYLSENYPGPTWRGVYHSSELFFVFGAPLFTSELCPGDPNMTCPQIWETSPKWNDDDTNMSQTLIDIWSKFAKMRHKQDTLIAIHNGSNWNTFGKSKEFLHISNSLELRKNPRNQVLTLWDNFNFLDFYAYPDSHVPLV